MLPQALCALVLIFLSIKNRKGCENGLLGLFQALLYPLVVPAASIIWAARELFWGEYRQDDLTYMKGWKLFEHLGKGRVYSIQVRKILDWFSRGELSKPSPKYFL